MIRFALVLSALLAFAPAACAQFRDSGVVTLLSLTGTNRVSATITNTYTLDADVSRSSQVALWFSFTGIGEDANAEAVTFEFARGLDSTKLEPTPSISITIDADSTNTVMYFTNVTIGAERILRLQSLVNANTNWLTNVVVAFSFKR